MNRTTEPIRIGPLEIRFLLEGAATAGSLAMFEFDVPANARVPIAHRHDAVHVTRDAGIMTDNDHGEPQLPVQLAQQVIDGLGGGRIQLTRGLIGQQKLRTIRQSDGDGHALLFPAGEFLQPVVASVSEPHHVEQLERALAGRLACLPG